MAATSLSKALHEFDRLAAADATPEALAWLARLRPRFMAQADALLRARFLLRAGALRDCGQSVDQVIEDLLLALTILKARGRPAEQAHALARLAYWYQHRGLFAPALWAGQQAMARPALPSAERTRLQVVMVSALAMQRLMPEAWAMLAATDAQHLPRADAWLLSAVRANLHQIEALRALRLVSVYTRDQPPGLEPDAAAAELHLAASEALLAGLPPSVSGLPVLAYLRAVLCAMRQDRAGCLQALAGAQPNGPAQASLQSRAVALYNQGWCQRVLGEPAAALASHQQAWAMVSAQPASRLQGMICLDLATCASQLGDPAEALRWLDRCLQVNALLSGEEYLASATLAKALDPAPPAVPRAPQPAVDQAPRPTPVPPAIEGEPAYLAEAEALYLARLPHRLPLPVLARALGLSIRTLQAAARRHRQCTLGDMLRQQLMARARTLLRESPLSIAEVAQALGYQDASSLSRDVRRHFGCTPRALRAAAPARAGLHPSNAGG